MKKGRKERRKKERKEDKEGREGKTKKLTDKENRLVVARTGWWAK